MKIPGPDHPIEITDENATVRVTYNGKTIAESTHALVMQEADYPRVHYIPRDDVNMAFLIPTDHDSHCPYKGDASYFSLEVDGQTAENAVWYYDDPYPAVTEIRDHVAFYNARVDAIDVI